MNLILLFQDDFIDNTGVVRLEGRRLKHVLDVHRASIGDELFVGRKTRSPACSGIQKSSDFFSRRSFAFCFAMALASRNSGRTSIDAASTRFSSSSNSASF